LQHSPLIEKYLSTIQTLQTSKQAPVLDLACGHGRNGLYLVENDINVCFADVNGESLEQVEQSLHLTSIDKQKLAECWEIDFEQANTDPLFNKSFTAVMVFRYLHRPLFDQIKAAIKPGGMIIYETFTQQQAQFGRPKNPDFLLKPSELADLFEDWQILHSFEGVKNASQNGDVKQAIAQIVAVKPI
jgi:SAM-dependent methyltransferase